MPFDLTNMDEERAWAGGILGPGRHECVVTDVEEQTSSGGHPQMVLTLEAVAGPEEGSTVKDWVVVIPSTFGKVKQILEAAGVEIQGGDWTFDASVLRGRRVAVLVREEPKRSDPSQTVSVVAAYSRPRVDGEVPADLDGLGGNGSASQSDQDIPF